MIEKELPKHIGIIMDGNRRWAKSRGLTTVEGHKKGYKTFEDVSQWCVDRGINNITFWAFSTENWSRPKYEVTAILKLLKFALRHELQRFMKKNIRFNVLGRVTDFSKDIQKEIKHVIKATKNNTRAILNIGLNYGGQEEIVDAMKTIIKKGLSPAKITAKEISKHMYLPNTPNPDLIIRTSGEQRTSGFFLWQAAYAELYFCKSLWPDFSENDLDNALKDFSKRQRNFGS